MTTFEEAKRCPKCNNPGEVVLVTDIPGGGKVHTIECRNTRCEWDGQPWVVQTRPDGTIPDPNQRRGPKRYPEMSPDQIAMGQRYMEDIEQRDLRGE